MLRDDIRELRRTVLASRQAAEDVWPRLADDLASNPRPHFIAKAAESCEEGPSVSVEVITPIEGEVEIGETLRAANVYSSFTQYAVLPQHQKMLVVRGDHPRWQPNTGYAGGDLVTYDNGGGLKRWERKTSGTSGATFDSDDWTEIEAATGWRIGYLFEHVAVATATTDHDGLDGKSFNAELDDSSPAIELVDVLNPLGQDVATDDKVLIYFWGQDLADAANTPFLILSESSLGGGGADTDELFKVSADDTTAGYFETKMANSGTYNASNHNLVYRETINGGSNETFRLFTAKATAPAADNDRLLIGVADADVNVDDASFLVTSPFPLADGDSIGASVTVHDPIGSYKAGDTIIAVWFDSAGEWRDITPSRYGILKGTVDEASGVTLGEDNWTVDGLEILAGSRDPGTSSVQVYGAKQAYADNAEVTIIWSDENERWEDFTDLNEAAEPQTYNVKLQAAKTKAATSVSVKFLEDDLTTENGSAFTAYDPHAQFSSGKVTDAIGRVTRVTDPDTGNNRFELTHLRQLAEYVRGDLSTDESSGSATDTGGYTAWGGAWQDTSPTGTITITGLDGQKSGDEYVAVLEDPDSTPQKYRMVEIVRSGTPLGVIEPVSIILDVPARSGAVAGSAASSGDIYAMCNADNVGQSGIVINGRTYDFTSASLGELIEPNTPVTVRLFNKSFSQVEAPASGLLFCDAKKIGNGDSEDDPPQEEYEIVSPLELRTLTGFDGDGTADQVITHVDGDIEWEDTGACS